MDDVTVPASCAMDPSRSHELGKGLGNKELLRLFSSEPTVILAREVSRAFGERLVGR